MSVTSIAPVDRALASDFDYAREERLRIARELHDVIGYGFAAISVQATTAAHTLATRPEQALVALRAIQAVSTEALCELRSILGLMRATSDDRTPSPPPGLARLDDLAATITNAGVETRVRVEGRRRPLPAEIDLAAFRIIQESLVNVLRHAGHTTASVRVGYARDRVVVEVVNEPGEMTAASARNDRGRARHGIVGMKERAVAVGGELSAEPSPTGGYRVRATLPSRCRS